MLTIDVTTGQESDTFSKEPAVTTIEISALDAEGTTISTASSVPGGTFSFGELPVDQFVQLSLVGRDASGTTRVRGRTLGLVLGQLQSDVLPVFAARVGELARPPGSLPHGRVDGVTATVGERYVVLAGGDAPDDGDNAGGDAAAYYDLFALGGTAGQALPRAPKTLALGGNNLLVIDDSGASLVDYAANKISQPDAPDEFDFDTVAGGSTVLRGDGASYVVGGTRAEAASATALFIGDTLQARAFAVTRNGAAATWLDNVGLVVAGGSSTGPGVEVLADDATSASTRPFDPDPIRGAAAVPAAGSILLLGGLDGDDLAAATRSIDPTCVSDCESQGVNIDLGARLDRCHAFLIGPEQALLLGQDVDLIQSRAFAIDLVNLTAVEVPLREPRSGASVTPTPFGTLALMGGQTDAGPALSIEIFTPP